MGKLKKLAIVLVLCVVSFSAGRYLGPASESKTETEHTQTQTDENINKNQNVTEITKRTTMPDGTVIVETRKEKETSTQTQVQRLSEADSSSKTQTENRPSYRLGVMYEPAIRGFQDVVYGGIIERRLFSEVYLGVTANSRHTFGFSLSVGI
jgi:hypothetical protein